MTRWELEWMIELAAAYLHAKEGKWLLYLDQGLILAREVEIVEEQSLLERIDP